MKYYIILLFTLLSTSLSAIKADPALKKTVGVILSHPESAAFIRSVERDGEITVLYQSFGDQTVKALWDADDRIIFVNNKTSANSPAVISSIIFELHNASSTKELITHFDRAEMGTYSKEQFVVAIERMEHRNALAAQKLIERGVAYGRFPEASRIFHFDEFNDYYALQQVFGHSQWIADKYDMITHRNNGPYVGTISHLPLDTREERLMFVDYLALKNEPEFANRKTRLDWLQRRCAQASHREMQLLNFVFEEDLAANPLYFGRANPAAHSI